MDKKIAAQKIIECALPHIPFDGWTQTTLSKAAEDAGYRRTDAIRVFPGGAVDAVDRYLQLCDEKMEAQLQNYSLDTMKIRARIATAVRLRISQHDGHKEALRKAIALQAMPFFLTHGLTSLYRTVDSIWYAIGDQSTDFNFYTKRLTLAAVYSSTLLFWLEDKSPSSDATWAFLDRRIEDVMQIEKVKSKLRQWVS